MLSASEAHRNSECPMKKKKGKDKIHRLIEALRIVDPERVYLFGSFAHGTEDDLSDLDVVVIQRSQLPFMRRLLEVGRVVPADLGAVDLFVYTPDEFTAMLRDGNAFAEMVLEEGRLVYER